MLEQLESGLALLVLERVDRRRNACNDLELSASAAQEPLRLTGLQQQVDGDCSLVREQAEELHLLQAEQSLLRPVEDGEDAERTLLVEERGRHEPLRHVARFLGDVAREARIVLD